MYTDEQLIDYIRHRHTIGPPRGVITIKKVRYYNDVFNVSCVSVRYNKINDVNYYQSNFYIKDIKYFLLSKRIDKINKIKLCLKRGM